MNYAAIRLALADRLENVDALVAVYPSVPDRVVTPSAAVVPGDPFADFHQASDGVAGGLIRCRFDVIVFAARFDSSAGQETLDSLISEIPAQLEGDQTLGGAAVVVLVTEATNYGVIQVADTQLVGCRIAVEVYTQ